MNLSNALPLNIVVPVMPSVPVEQGTPTLDFAAMVQGMDVVHPQQPATAMASNPGVEILETDISARPIHATTKSIVALVVEPVFEEDTEAEAPKVSSPDIQPVTALIASLLPNAICSNTVILRNEATLQSGVALTNPGLPRFARNDDQVSGKIDLPVQDTSSPPLEHDDFRENRLNINRSPELVEGCLADKRPSTGSGLRFGSIQSHRSLDLLSEVQEMAGKDFEHFRAIPVSISGSTHSLPSKKPSPAEPLFQKVELAPLTSDMQTFLAVPALQITTAPSLTTPVSSTDLAALTDRHLNLARESAWLDTLASDIVAASNASDRLTFHLSPAHLGRLDIDLSQSSGGLSVHMTASTDNATNIIAAAQPRLIEELRHQGVRVSGAEVATGGQQQPTPQTRQPVQIIEHAALDRDDETDISPDTRSSGRFA
jgi:Flagellar hook-length control protein FliK